MKPLLKRLGAAGIALLVLNEIRGLVVLALALEGLLSGDLTQAAHGLSCGALLLNC